MRKQILGIVAVILVVAGIGIWFQNKEVSEETLRVDQENKCHVQMLAMDEEGMLVPLTIPCEKEQLKSKMHTVITAMQEKKLPKGLKTVLPKNTKLLDVSLVNDVLVMQFNEQLLKYPKEQELRILEALVWIGLQFDEVKQVELQIGETPLTTLPYGTPVPQTLDEHVGINNFISAGGSLHASKPLTVFFTKEVAGRCYYVPKTKRLRVASLDEEIEAVLADISVTSSLKQPLAQEKVKAVASSTMKESVLALHLNEAILQEDRTAKKAAYETLILSLSMLEGVEHIQVSVDDVAVTLHGMNEDAINAKLLLYNEIK